MQRRTRRVLSSLVVAMAVLATASLPSAGAQMKITEWDGAIKSVDPDLLRAGEHPDSITTVLELGRHIGEWEAAPGRVLPDAAVRNLVATLPAGLVGAPTTVAQCKGLDELAPAGAPFPTCPVNSIVGIVEARTERLPGEIVNFTSSIFNMRPPAGVPARFGFNIGTVPVLLDAEVRSDGDYGVNLLIRNQNQQFSFLGATTTFWGTPGAAVHDIERCQYHVPFAVGEPSTAGCTFGPPGDPVLGENPFTFGVPRAFLTLPTSCTAPGQGLEFGIDLESWEQPSTSDHSAFTTRLSPPDADTLLGTSQCGKVPFSPHVSVQPTTDEAETPTGLEVRLDVSEEGFNNPAGIAQSHLKDAKVTLPEGMTVNPSYGNGVVACTAAQIGLTTGNSPEVHFNKTPAQCPDASQIGEVRVDTPALDVPLTGNVYVAQQDDPKAPGAENPFDSTLALYIVAEGAGVRVKLAGKVAPDQRTGQVVTTFLNNPQVPFSHFTLKFNGGQRAPLATPPICGTHTVKAELTPWARPNQPVTVSDSFNITKGPNGGPCPNGQTPPFKPGLLAGTVNNAAGSYSPFNLRLTREDGEQEFTNFSIKLPPGLIGKLAGIPFCSDAAIQGAKGKSGGEEISNPSCPKASEVGRTEVGAGVGSLLVYAPGKVYLAGPYNGSALSIAAITAAKVGPFDLGTVVVREALKVNPETAEVFIDATGSDPIPHIIDGVVVHARDIRVFTDKPQFILNPTNCKRTSTASTVLGSGLDFASAIDDNPITVTSPFQAADCGSLGFKPKLALSLIGGTKRGDNPKFKAVLTARKGDANIATSQVTLPHSEFLDNEHIKTICTRAQFKEGTVPGEKCPAASIYGYAKAETPLLDEPLQGPVFLRSSSHNLPDLLVALHSGKININLAGRIDSVQGGRIRNTFEAVPDAPVTRFTLTMQGGKKGLLVNSTNLCKSTNRAIVAFGGQNGKQHNFNPVVKPSCKKHKAKKKSKR